MVSSILTNGSMVTRELLDGIAALGMHPSFQMSFDGVGWHDWIKGIDGAEKKVLDAFRLMKEYGIGVSSAMCLHKNNIHTIRESVNLLAEVGCSSLKINVANPSGLWENQPEHFITQEEGYQALLLPGTGTCFLPGRQAGFRKIYIYATPNTPDMVYNQFRITAEESGYEALSQL